MHFFLNAPFDFKKCINIVLFKGVRNFFIYFHSQRYFVEKGLEFVRKEEQIKIKTRCFHLCGIIDLFNKISFDRHNAINKKLETSTS